MSKEIKDPYWDQQDDWEQSDEDVYETECCRCEIWARCKRTPDPYVKEIHPEDYPEPEYWCYPCWSARHDEI
jgi:hypothetical protein